MSIISWHLTPGRASIATDTLTYDQTGAPMFFSSKIFPIPHLQMAVADQGSQDMAFALFKFAVGTFMPDGIDDFARLAPHALRRMKEEFLADYGEHLDERVAQTPFQALAFGYSARQERMVGYGFDGTIGFEAHAFDDGTRFVPPPKADRSDPRVDEIARKSGKALAKTIIPETLIAAAKLQRLTCDDILGHGSGGDLILVEITKHKIETRKVHRFSDYAQTLEAMPAYERGVEAKPQAPVKTIEPTGVDA